MECWARKQGNISEHTALALAAEIRQLRSEKSA